MTHNSMFRAVWRWHFYAGLLVLPFLLWLAVTGGLYLYKAEIEQAFYHDWLVLSGPVVPLPVDAMIDRVEQQTNGQVTQIARPSGQSESWRMNFDTPGGESRTAFVDPGSGRVLGITAKGGVMETVRALHSLAITGTLGNALIEIVAGWAIILALTGVYLWWPSGNRRALALRGRPDERRFWRDLHASVGGVVALVLLFLAVTGMPWSVFWGANLQQMVAANGLGRPQAPGPQPWEVGAGHKAHQAANGAIPWAMQAAPVPHARGGGDIGPGKVLAIAQQRGIVAPYALTLPVSDGGPYSVSTVVSRASDIRLIYVEPSSGKILQDVSYSDFGAGAQAIEWGIYTHQGQNYGEFNRLVMLAGCIGIVLLAISAPVLWWKRRRAGRLAAPPPPADRRAGHRLLALMLVPAVLYPLTGLTMLAALLGDWLFARFRSPAVRS